MKTKALILLALVSMSMTSCKNAIKEISEQAKQEFKKSHEYRDSEKWGKVVEKEIGDEKLAFDNLQIDGNVEIFFSQDSIFSIKVYGNEKAIDEYQFMTNTNSDGTVTEVINLKGFEWNATKENHNITKDTPAITVYVTAPSLTGITVYGAGDICIDEVLSQKKPFRLEVNGAGDFDASEMEVESFFASINGAGDIEIEEIKCEANAEFTINGAGSMDTKVKCENASLEVNGAGDVKLNIKCNNLSAACNGTGDIRLKGECNRLIKSDNAIGGIDSRDLLVNGKIETRK